MSERTNQLVAVGVLAYNSATTIIDTLDSIAAQTYRNIELIVSDDGSQDNTVEIVSCWIEEHKNRFVRTELLSVENNTGTPANSNRLIAAAKAEWMKSIAADDILLPNCVEDFVEYVNMNPEVRIVYSRYKEFITGEDGKFIITGDRLDDEINQLFDTDPRSQLYIYIEKGFNISPAVFKNVEYTKSIGYLEKYRVFEDTPFYLRVLMSGTKIYYMNKNTVLYRNDGDSVTRERNKEHFYKKTFVDNNLMFRKDWIYSLYPWYRLDFWVKEYSFRLQYFLTIRVLHNKRSEVNNVLYYFFKILNPYYVIKYLFDFICK